MLMVFDSNQQIQVIVGHWASETMQIFDIADNKKPDQGQHPDSRLNLLSIEHSDAKGVWAQVRAFSRSYGEALVHPFGLGENTVTAKAAPFVDTSLAAQAGHLAGQFTDAAVAMAIARELPFLKASKVMSHEQSFLHAPATLVPRESTLATTFAKPSAHLIGNIHMDAEDYSLTSDVSHLIESTSIAPTTYKMTKPGMPDQHFETTEPFKFYKLKGIDTRIGLPADFADSLEKIRRSRFQSAGMEGFERDQFDASRSAHLHGYDSAILPEQMAYFLRELPNPSLVKEVLLIPQADAKAGAAVDLDIPGRVQLFGFKRFLDPYIDTAEAPFYLRHEWSHLAERENDSLSSAFKVAHNLESKGFFAHKTAVDNPSEDWAVHLGENLMDSDAHKFLETVERAPLRSLVLLQSLKEQLARGTESVGSSFIAQSHQPVVANPLTNPYGSQLRARVQMGEQLLIPEVRSLLRQKLVGPGSTQGLMAHRYATFMRQNGIELLSSH